MLDRLIVGHLLQDSPIRPDAHGAHPYIEIGEADGEEAEPGPHHVAAVEAAHAIVRGSADGALGHAVEHAADQVAERVASEGVAAQQDHVDEKNYRTEAYAEVTIEPHREPNIVGEQDQEEDGEIQKIAMDVLNDEREGALAEIFFARLTDGASGRIGPERFVVGAAIVVAGEAESAWGPEDEHRASYKGREPGGEDAEPGIFARGSEKFGGIKRRKIGTEAIVIALQRSPGGVDDVDPEAEEDEQRLDPPRIAPSSLAETSLFQRDIDRRHRNGQASGLGGAASSGARLRRVGLGTARRSPRGAGGSGLGIKTWAFGVALPGGRGSV